MASRCKAKSKSQSKAGAQAKAKGKAKAKAQAQSRRNGSHAARQQCRALTGDRRRCRLMAIAAGDFEFCFWHKKQAAGSAQAGGGHGDLALRPAVGKSPAQDDMLEAWASEQPASSTSSDITLHRLAEARARWLGAATEAATAKAAIKASKERLQLVRARIVAAQKRRAEVLGRERAAQLRVAHLEGTLKEIERSQERFPSLVSGIVQTFMAVNGRYSGTPSQGKSSGGLPVTPPFKRHLADTPSARAGCALTPQLQRGGILTPTPKHMKPPRKGLRMPGTPVPTAGRMVPLQDSAGNSKPISSLKEQSWSPSSAQRQQPLRASQRLAVAPPQQNSVVSSVAEASSQPTAETGCLPSWMTNAAGVSAGASGRPSCLRTPTASAAKARPLVQSPQPARDGSGTIAPEAAPTGTAR
eukprot:TRINITY_DN44565_c0_g1_i1.p1 TRINITY_DN44565_c0_g1~~TRINITY_DN44565_c0_g1_i1.p1  ORF type:complete len:414 (+),score=93.95 TRINITY_DN44565_c0_g1_i1:200-1441(+)